MKVKYSDKELQEFRSIILQKIEETKLSLPNLKEFLRNDNNKTDDTGRSFNLMEDSSQDLTREEVHLQILRLEKFIQDLENALIRIKNGVYGICRVTGKLIPKDRLLIVPHATLSVEGKEISRQSK